VAERRQLEEFVSKVIRERIWIVGECFADAAAAHESIYTVSGFLRQLNVRPEPLAGAEVSAGLGVDAISWSYLWDVLAERGVDVLQQGDGPPAPIVPRQRVHKHRQDEVLIAGPRLRGNEDAIARLVVPDDAGAARGDTRRWQHVPASVLMEACTQLVVWSCDETYAPGADHMRASLHHGCRFDFERFVFPAPVRLRACLRQRGPASAERVLLEADVTVEQLGKVAARCRYEVQSFKVDRLRAFEHAQAVRAMSLAESFQLALPLPRSA
jgi:A-factor biosynthesis hotdog protein